MWRQEALTTTLTRLSKTRRRSIPLSRAQLQYCGQQHYCTVRGESAVMDLDCWLQGGDIPVPDALTLSGREKFFSPIVTKLF
jgi:hypothetical protein